MKKFSKDKIISKLADLAKKILEIIEQKKDGSIVSLDTFSHGSQAKI